MLSAVARRKAKLESGVTAASDSSQETNNTSGALTDINPPPTLSLKRKTSARSLKQNGDSVNLTLEPQSRKKLKAPQYTQIVQATEPLVLLDDPRERPYSPSQPFGVSSDEEGDISAPIASELVCTNPQIAESDSAVRPARIIPELIEMKNYFSLTPEEACSITGRRMAARIILLNEGESLFFVGAMELTLLQGSIQLLGTTLTPSRTSHKIFAPRSHPIPILDALSQQAGTSSQDSSQKICLVSELPVHIIKSISTAHVVVVIQELVTGVEGLERVVQTFTGVFEPDFRDRSITEQILESVYMYKSESQYDSSFYFPDDWQQAVTNILSAIPNEETTEGSGLYDVPVILVRGAKNSGKSTFSRSLANNLINRYHQVAFIECDIGQSEFTPGGMVSLNLLKNPVFGPPFTHPSRPRYAHFVGGNSPKTSPSHYLAALADLAHRYQLEFKYSGSLGNDTIDEESVKISNSVPLIINTQGWIKGMGADLLRSIDELAFSQSIDLAFGRAESKSIQ
ncbi:Polynucleotide 5'-hydroxyl-kinase GRC3 [Cryptococcus neoformans var, neoformans B-3501A] [Rhizoctonia solani]|uniref:Polynucleotide 5'-hydroxyl-kinase GRC3 n=1 Tax=Rhizoctonia solani TaxID=456999 RepID=A0A0K6FW42_9AGAM|nr:Polynucleotide 5'-hydroxyl-kinase GRC3 [Cryptococcus neoformans var, neoformans B-3501A] [Rhizoctonia solani]